MDNKKLVINSATCDTRLVTEEILNLYENVTINAANVLVSKESKELLSRYQVAINTSDTMEIPMDAQVITQNGSYEISEGTIMSKPTVLIINGSLQIMKNSEKALETLISIHVNGSVSYPSDLQNKLPPLSVNGSTNTYPADAIYMKNTLTLDKAFVLRAKDAKYYVKNKVVIADETLDISSLVAKGTSFITKKAILVETLLENAVQLFDDNTDIIIIPAGYQYVQGGKLSDLMVNNNGGKLFIDGDLMITSESEHALNKLTDIKVSGSIYVSGSLMNTLLHLNSEYNDIKQIKGHIIADKGMLSIGKQTFADLDDGVTIMDCGMVRINKDITSSDIENKLQFIDCGVIVCHPEQRGVIELVSEDVGLIKDKGIDKVDDMDETSDGSGLYSKNTQVINAATYKM